MPLKARMSPARGTRRDGVVRRGIFAALTGAALCLTASVAQAAPFVDVKYDLSDTGGTLILSLPSESVHEDLRPEYTSGTATLRYSSDSLSGAADGPVSLASLSWRSNVPLYTDYITYELLSLGTLNLHLQLLNAPLVAGALSGGVISPQGGSASLRITGGVYCIGLCNIRGTAPLEPITVAHPPPTLFTTGDAATVTGTTTLVFTLEAGAPYFLVEVLPITLRLNLVGREISRTPVPEPGTLELVGVGVGALALAGGGGWVARRRRD